MRRGQRSHLRKRFFEFLHSTRRSISRIKSLIAPIPTISPKKPRKDRNSGRPFFRPFALESLEPRHTVSSITFANGLLNISWNDSQSLAISTAVDGSVLINGATVANGSSNLLASQVSFLSITETSGQQVNLSGVTSSAFSSLNYNSLYVYEYQSSDTVTASQFGETVDGFGSSGSGSGSGSSSGFSGSSGGANTLDGGAGHDTLNGQSASYNILYGGSGVETLNGGSGTNVLVGSGNGYNTLNGGTGSNSLYGGAGTNILANNNYSGTNALTGGAGVNTLISHGGWSYLTAGSGPNTLIAQGGGTNTIYGSGATGSATLNAYSGGTNTLYGGLGSNLLMASGGGYSGSGSNVLYGGPGSNTLDGSFGSGMNLLYGGSGPNLLNANGGTNTLYGGYGSNSFNAYSGGSNTLFGGTGVNTLTAWAGSGTNVLYGSGSANVLVGGSGSATNTLYGAYSGSDTLYDHGGVNTLISIGGNDTLYGTGSGWNTIALGSGGPSLTYQGGAYTVSNPSTNALSLDVNADNSNNVTIKFGPHATLVGYAGPITTGSGNALSVIKDGSGVQSLVGTNNYYGSTTINSGTLALFGQFGNTAIGVGGGATFAIGSGSGWSAGNTGSGSGASLTLSSGATFSMVTGDVQIFTLSQKSGFAGASLTINGATLDFDLNSAGADELVTNSAASVSGTNTINVNALGNSLTAGQTYTLVSAASGLTGNFQFANGSDAELTSVGGQEYVLALNNSNSGETLSVYSYSSLSASYTLPSFVWPEAPNDNGAVVPSVDEQPQPPQAPAYTGDTFDYTQDSGYQAAVSTADNTYSTAAANAQSTYDSKAGTALGTKEQKVYDASLAYNSEVSTAENTYNTSRANAPQLDNDELQDLENNETAAWTAYNGPNGAETTNGDTENTTIDNAAATEGGQSSQASQQETEDLQNAAQQDEGNWDAYQSDQYQIVKQYASTAQGDLDQYNQKVVDANRDYLIAQADAYLTLLQTLEADYRDIAKLQDQFSQTSFDQLLSDQQTLISAIATATFNQAVADADAQSKYEHDLADAAQQQAQNLADAQRDHDQAVAQAQANAFANWADEIDDPGNDSTSDEIAWANYQVNLANNNNQYQQAVDQLIWTNAYTKAGDAWNESTSVADSQETQQINDAQADENRTNSISSAMATLETQIEASETTRDAGGSDSSVDALADAWYTHQVAVDTAVDAQSDAHAQINAKYNLLDDEARDAWWAANQWDSDVHFSDGSMIDNSQTRQDNPVTYARAEATDQLNNSLDTADADKSYQDALVNADKAWQEASAEGFENSDSNVSDYYATYEITIARAQDTYNAAIASDAGDEAVAAATAQAAQQFCDTQADADMQSSGASETSDESSLSDARDIADATAKQNFEVGEATAYLNSVESWAALISGGWGAYQVALAQDNLTLVSSTDSANVNRASQMASVNDASAQADSASNMVYATSMYGGEDGGGAYVGRAQSIANANVAAVSGANSNGPGPLETFATAEANAVRDHDQGVADQTETLFDGIAGAEATLGLATDSANHECAVQTANDFFDEQKPAEDNPISYSQYVSDCNGFQLTRSNTIFAAERDCAKQIADLDSTWLHQVSSLDVSLSNDWVTAQTNQANADATAAIAASSSLAGAEQTYEDADAAASETRSNSQADAAQTYSNNSAQIQADFTLNTTKLSNQKTLEDTTAQGIYNVGVYSDHASAMTQAYDSDPNPTPLEQYQMLVAEADLTQAESQSTASNSQASAADGPNGTDNTYAQQVHDASIALANQDSTANHDSAYRESEAEYNLTVAQDAAEANLYIGEQTAEANLPAQAVGVEGTADNAYANAESTDNSTLIDDADTFVKAVADIDEQFDTLQITYDQQQSQIAAAQQTKDSADQTANNQFAAAVAQLPNQEQTNIGPVRQTYVAALYGAQVDYVTAENQAQSTFEAASDNDDGLITTALAQATYTNQQALSAASSTQEAANDNEQVTYQTTVSGASVVDQTQRAAAEQSYQVATADAAAQSAASTAAASPGDANAQFQAAQAAAFASWITALSTPAAGQTESPYVIYQAGLAQAQAQSTIDLAIASATLDISQSSATAIDTLANDSAGRDRTIALDAAQDSTDQWSVANENQSDLSSVQNDEQQAIDYVTASITYNTQVASIDTQYAADSNYSAEQTDLAQAEYVQAAAFAQADENWSDRAAIDEQTFAIAEANRTDAFEQQQGVDQQTYSDAIASNQQTDDERQAAAEAQNQIDQTTANNVQDLGAATASANFDTAQFAANVVAMNALAANMPSGSTAIGPLPWAQYEVKLAVGQQATWNSQLDAAYLNLQQQTANAETAYAASEAATAIASADQVAEQTYSNSVYAAGRTEQEVAGSAGIEQTFNQNLANSVVTYRDSIAEANYNYAVAQAAATRDQTWNSGDYDDFQTATDSANTAYQDQYVQLDGTRRSGIAAAGLSLEQDLSTNSQAVAATIAQDEASADASDANAYYVPGSNGGAGSGAAATLAALDESFAIATSTDFANGLTALAAPASTAIWDLFPFASQAADNAETQSTTVDIPADEANYAADIAQAAANNADSLSSDASDQQAWLADVQSADQQAIQTAQTTLSTANSGGDPTQVTLPTPLTPPSNIDIGTVSLPNPSELVSPLATGWNSYGLGVGGYSYDGAITGWGYINGWSGFYGAAWGGGGVEGSLASWTDAGMAVPLSTTAYPFNYSILDGNGFGGTGYGYQYGLSVGAWYWTGDANLLPGLTNGQASPSAPNLSDPVAAVSRQQSAILSTEAQASIGNDILQTAKSMEPASIKALTGLVTIAAAVAFTEVSSGDSSDVPKFAAPTQDEFNYACDTICDYNDGDPDAYKYATDPKIVYAREIYDRGVAYGMDDYDFSHSSPTGADSFTATASFSATQVGTVNGATVLQIIQQYGGTNGAALADFVAKHFQLVAATPELSALSIAIFVLSDPLEAPPPPPTTNPSVTVLLGTQTIANVNGFTGPTDAYNAAVRIGIPKNWSNAANGAVQVAQYILQQLSSNDLLRYIGFQVLGDIPSVVQQLQTEAFESAASEAGGIASMYYGTLNTLNAGGMGVMAVHDASQGRWVGAALAMVFATPVAALLGKGVKVFFEVGEEPVIITESVLKRFDELVPAEQEELKQVLASAETPTEAETALDKVLENPELRTAEKDAAAGVGSAANVPGNVSANDALQRELVSGQQARLKAAIDAAPAAEKAAVKGRILHEQGHEFQNLSTNTLEQIPGATVRNDVSIGTGLGSEVDNVVTSGTRTVMVESKFTIADLEQRTINQITNAVNSNGRAILNVAREPTAAELANLKTALGEKVFEKVKVVSSQSELFEAAASALQ